MSESLNWDDVRVFLAVLRASSARKAADDLGVSRPTVSRRLEAFEARLGLELFERRSDGLHATAAATELLPAAEAAERALMRVSRAAQAADPHIRGPIRVAVPAIVAADLLMPDLVAFAKAWPEIELYFSGSYDLADHARREADVAIRFMPVGKLPSEELTGRKVGNAYQAIYGSGDQWIGQYRHRREQSWVADTEFPELPVRGRIFDGEILRSAVVHGLGMARLPCFMADPRLRRRSKPEPGFDVWILVHPDLRKNPRLRLFRDAMLKAFKRLRPVLEGRKKNPLLRTR
jgi:DNA-binding transcriptional LysR family regulator